MQAMGFRVLDILSERSQLQQSPLRCSPSYRMAPCRHEALLRHDIPQRALIESRAASLMHEDESIEEDFFASIPYGYDAEALEAAREVDREQGLQQYAELKKRMLARTRRFGTLLSGYLLLQVSASTAPATLIGTAGSFVYLRLLISDMDNISASDAAPFTRTDAQQQGPARLLLQGAAAYRQALKPRLLVAVGLGAAVAAYNRLAEQPMGGTEEFALLGGFLSYKASLLLEVWDALKPKFDPEALDRQQRPQLPVLPELEPLDLQSMRESKKESH